MVNKLKSLEIDFNILEGLVYYKYDILIEKAKDL